MDRHDRTCQPCKTRGAPLRGDRRLPLTRRKSGRGFAYFDGKGRLIRDRAVIDRINALAIPPAWEDVRIAADIKAHIQAIGRDSLGRLQYRYHPAWTAVRDTVKAERLLRFGSALPKIRARLEKDLARRKTDRRYAAAAAARLIDQALLRSGHAGGMEGGGRGAATLLKRDVKLNGTKVHLNFTGKSGKQIRKSIRDPILLARLRKLKRIGKKRLFAFHDESGACCYLSARDLNAYLREAAGTLRHRQGFSHLRRHRTCAVVALRSGMPADRARTEIARRHRDAGDLGAPRQHAGGDPLELRPSPGSGGLRGGADRRLAAERPEPQWSRPGRDRADALPGERARQAHGRPCPPAGTAKSRSNVTRRDAKREKRPWLRRSSTTSGRSSRRSTSA